MKFSNKHGILFYFISTYMPPIYFRSCRVFCIPSNMTNRHCNNCWKIISALFKNVCNLAQIVTFHREFLTYNLRTFPKHHVQRTLYTYCLEKIISSLRLFLILRVTFIFNHNIILMAFINISIKFWKQLVVCILASIFSNLQLKLWLC